MEEIRSFKGHFLIATPELNQTPFEHSVIYMLSHDDEGAMGLVINKPHHISWADVCSQVGITPLAERTSVVLNGGPVASDHGYLLYQSDQPPHEQAAELAPRVHVTTSSTLLSELAEGRISDQFRFLLGYSGWGAGQLDQEILDGAWLTIKADITLLFSNAHDTIYQQALGQLGISLHHFSHHVGHA